MKLQHILVIAWALFVCALPLQATADSLAIPQEISEADIKVNLPQPYVVKKGDTLWDIANYFFKDPEKWLKIWERNLYISNPDLIYPGNEIWFNVKKKKNGGLSQIRPQPKVIYKPVEKLEGKIDTSKLLTALARQDFIQPGAIEGIGYILDSEDDRINYGANDRLYLKIKQKVNDGDVLDVFRTGDSITDPETGSVIGVLVNHLGQIEVRSEVDGIYRGLVLQTFEELSRGDRLKPAKQINTTITPSFPPGSIVGKVLYIRNNAAEAGQNQVIGISLGLDQGLKAGTALSVHRAGREIEDRVGGGTVTLPEEKIGELLVLVAQQDASLALVVDSTASINIGDAVRNKANR
ncbi:MAG: LysM peptidoglycan-binding domain-containing protein [Mariprofundaceae bacterium]